MTDKYITGKQIISQLEIRDFEIFDYLKKGLQPYTKLGKKIVDQDTLKSEKRNTYCSTTPMFALKFRSW